MVSRVVAVRRSPVHGRGAFAKVDLNVGETVIDYQGERITWAQACADHQSNGVAGHTFYFDLGDGTVIDGGTGGNAARWINHSCDPNCEAVNDDERIQVRTLQPVHAGDELTIDYNLIIEDPDDPEQRALYTCMCGADECRGTMLAAPTAGR
jgi:SET domain-containing protein